MDKFQLVARAATVAVKAELPSKSFRLLNEVVPTIGVETPVIRACFRNRTLGYIIRE
jgi:hypothetical protein